MHLFLNAPPPPPKQDPISNHGISITPLLDQSTPVREWFSPIGSKFHLLDQKLMENLLYSFSSTIYFYLAVLFIIHIFVFLDSWKCIYANVDNEVF